MKVVFRHALAHGPTSLRFRVQTMMTPPLIYQRCLFSQRVVPISRSPIISHPALERALGHSGAWTVRSNGEGHDE